MKINCPFCKQEYDIVQQLAGKKVACGACDRAFVVVSAEEVKQKCSDLKKSLKDEIQRLQWDKIIQRELTGDECKQLLEYAKAEQVFDLLSIIRKQFPRILVHDFARPDRCSKETYSTLDNLPKKKKDDSCISAEQIAQIAALGLPRCPKLADISEAQAQIVTERLEALAQRNRQKDNTEQFEYLCEIWGKLAKEDQDEIIIYAEGLLNWDAEE